MQISHFLIVWGGPGNTFITAFDMAEDTLDTDRGDTIHGDRTLPKEAVVMENCHVEVNVGRSGHLCPVMKIQSMFSGEWVNEAGK